MKMSRLDKGQGKGFLDSSEYAELCFLKREDKEGKVTGED